MSLIRDDDPPALVYGVLIAWIVAALIALCLVGCAPKTKRPDPPVHVSRCHAIVEGVTCTDTAWRWSTFCACVGEA